jgi:hypothetical protein
MTPQLKREPVPNSNARAVHNCCHVKIDKSRATKGNTILPLFFCFPLPEVIFAA